MRNKTARVETTDTCSFNMEIADALVLVSTRTSTIRNELEITAMHKPLISFFWWKKTDHLLYHYEYCWCPGAKECQDICNILIAQTFLAWSSFHGNSCYVNMGIALSCQSIYNIHADHTRNQCTLAHPGGRLHYHCSEKWEIKQQALKQQTLLMLCH